MDDIENLVKLLAYELWETAGRPSGRNDEFWFSAEAQIKQALAEPPAADGLVAESGPDAPVAQPVAVAAPAGVVAEASARA